MRLANTRELTLTLAIVLSVVCSFARGQETQPFIIEDYPRYATTPPPQFQDKLNRIGSALAGAARASDGSRGIQVSVIGHADFDAQGRAFENQVSADRAKSARTAIEEAFNRQAAASQLDPSKKRLVTFVVAGRGTSESKFPASAPMSQRVKNRRVEVTWAGTDVIRPTAEAGVDRCARIIAASSTTPKRKQRISCACSLLRDNKLAGDDYYSLKLFQEALGPRDGKTLTLEEMTKVFQHSRLHYRAGVEASNKAARNDAEFVKGLVDLDYRVIFEFNQFEKQFAVVPLMHDKVITALIGKSMLNKTHVLSCYAGASMQDLDNNR